MITENYPESKRMEDLLSALGKSANSLAKDLEYTPGTIYHILNGINTISEGMRKRILNKYPNVNNEFLLKGSLPVLLSGDSLEKQSIRLGIAPQPSDDFLILKRFATMPQDLRRVEDKLNQIIKHLGIE